MSTLFSKIITWEIPSYRIYEDEYTYAFLDIRPHVLGHSLIVPKIEVDHFSDLPEPYYRAIHDVAKILSKAIQKATWCNRIATMYAWYEIPHCHYHLIPTDTLSDLDSTAAHVVDPSELISMQKKILKTLETL